MTTFQDALYKLWPNGDTHIPSLRAAMVKAAPNVFTTYGINTKTAMLQFMAQVSHECGAGLEIEENLNYTAARMTEVWPTRFRTIGEAMPYAHNPRALGNKVYNGRMGNVLGTDDGYNYRGRGGTQVTGKEGYAKLGQKLGLDLLSRPDLVNEPEVFLAAAAADFNLCGCLLPALSDDLYHVTLRLNGGTVGLAERQQWLTKWKMLDVVFPTKTPPIMVPSTPSPPARVPAPTPTGNWLATLINAILAIFKRR